MKTAGFEESGLRERLLPLPGATASIKWEDDLVFSVCGKMFCALSLAGRRQGSLSFKVDAERFLEMTDRPGVRPAPYLARARWVTLDDPAALPADELAELLSNAYALVVARLTRAQRATLIDAAAPGD